MCKTHQAMQTFKSYYDVINLSFILTSRGNHVTERMLVTWPRRANKYASAVRALSHTGQLSCRSLLEFNGAWNLKFDAPPSVRGNGIFFFLFQHGNRKSTLCCCGVWHALLPRGVRLRSWPGTLFQISECDRAAMLAVLRLARHLPVCPFCADRPPAVCGAAAVGEWGRGTGTHLQDPAHHFHSQGEPAGLCRGPKVVLIWHGSKVYRHAKIHGQRWDNGTKINRSSCTWCTQGSSCRG